MLHSAPPVLGRWFISLFDFVSRPELIPVPLSERAIPSSSVLPAATDARSLPGTRLVSTSYKVLLGLPLEDPCSQTIQCSPSPILPGRLKRLPRHKLNACIFPLGKTKGRTPPRPYLQRPVLWDFGQRRSSLYGYSPPGDTSH